MNAAAGAPAEPAAARVRFGATVLCALAAAGMIVEWQLRDRGVLRQLIGSLLVAAAIGGALALTIVPRVPEAQRPFLWAYSVVLTAMLGVAGGTLGVGSRGLVPLAAGLFFGSDLCLAQTAFLRGGTGWTLAGYPIYYAACLLFAWSVNERPVVAPSSGRPALSHLEPS